MLDLLNKRTIALATLVAGALVLGPGPARGQETVLGDPATVALAVTQQRLANKQLFMEYSWRMRTEVWVDEEIELIKQELIQYSLEGQRERMSLGGFDPPDRKGNRRKARAEKREDLLDAVEDLLYPYTLPAEQAIVDYLEKATIGPGKKPGTLAIRGTDVVVPGDELTIWIDAETKERLQTLVRTHLKKDDVIMEATHGRLPSGLIHRPSYKVQIPAHRLVLKIETFDYHRRSLTE
jgi:hypothetical protein